MLFAWFDGKAANEFGTELGQFFIQRMPVDTQKSEKKFATRTSELLNKLTLRLNQFKSTNKLNFYTKAKLANSFKWTLKDAGYESKYVDDLTEWLVKQL